MSDFIIGADEVGTGAWAGPFFVCAVAVRKDWRPPSGLNDSKKMTKASRLKVYPSLCQLPMKMAMVTHDVIDTHGLRCALKAAFTQVIRELMAYYPSDTEVILDGNMKLPTLPKIRVEPKADTKYPVVMAASVIAKVNRDGLMKQYGEQLPGWDFYRNVGYGSNKHRLGLAQYGPSPIHRMSFRPIKDFCRKAAP